MKKFLAKMKKVRVTQWDKLTSGEKILKVIMTLIKFALIIALIVTVGSVILAVVAGVVIAFAIMSAVAGGFHNAGQAYSSRDRYYRDYDRDRDIW
jgi:hypothetical protein